MVADPRPPRTKPVRPLELCNLTPLMELEGGRAEVLVGVVDGIAIGGMPGVATEPGGRWRPQ